MTRMTTCDAIRDALATIGPMTLFELYRMFPAVKPNRLRGAIADMRKARLAVNRVHVGDWREETDSRGLVCQRPVFALGKKRDVPRPASKTASQIQAQRRERDRQARASSIVARVPVSVFDLARIHA